MASNNLASARGASQGRLHIGRMLAMLGVLVGVFAVLLLIVASAV